MVKLLVNEAKEKINREAVAQLRARCAEAYRGEDVAEIVAR